MVRRDEGVLTDSLTRRFHQAMDWGGFVPDLSASNLLEALREASLAASQGLGGQIRRDSNRGRRSARRNLPVLSRRNNLELPTACPADDSSCVYSCLSSGFHAEVRLPCSMPRGPSLSLASLSRPRFLRPLPSPPSLLLLPFHREP